MTRFRMIAATVALATAGTLLVASPASAYCPDGPCSGYNGWAKGDAYTYAYHGLGERYVFGGTKGWIDNNTWDSSSTEGVDCSEYVRRVWALPSYVGEHASTSHPYTTYTFYYGNVSSTYRISGSDMNSGNAYGDPWMTTWVYRDDQGGPGDHMGLFYTYYSDGYWNTMEAKGSDYGIVRGRRRLSDLLRWGYRRYERSGWSRY